MTDNDIASDSVLPDPVSYDLIGQSPSLLQESTNNLQDISVIDISSSRRQQGSQNYVLSLLCEFLLLYPMIFLVAVLANLCPKPQPLWVKYGRYLHLAMVTVYYFGFPKDLRGMSTHDTATHNRPQWGSTTEYYLVALGYAVGYGSLWRFPYLVYNNGGGAFLIPYFFFVIVLCFPMLYLETSVGQLFKTSVIGIFNKVGARFKGIGYAQMIITFFMGSYYNILLAYSTIFLWNSLSWSLPWKVEDTENTGILWNPEYFYKDILNITDSIANLGNMNYPILLCSIISFVICYLCISKGISGTGKVVYITAPAPYLFLFVFLIRGFFLDGAWDGVAFLFKVDWSKLFDLDTWFRAANQVLFQYSLANGVMFAFASYKDKQANLTRPAIIIPAVTGLTGILCGLTVFTYMGHMAKVAGVSISQLPLSGPDLVFVAYPAALTLMPGSTLWAIAFFVMLFFLGIDTEFAFMEALSGFLEDEKITVFGKIYPIKVMRILVVIGLFVAGLPLNFDGGFYFLSFYDDYSTIVPMMFAAFLECYVFGWVYGTDKIDRMIQDNTGERFPRYATVCIKYIILPIMAFLTLSSFIKLIFVDLLTLPWWAIIIGLALLLTPIIFIAYFYFTYKDRRSHLSTCDDIWIELEEPMRRAIKDDSY